MTKKKIPAWEWLVAALGLIVLLLVMGALVWEGARPKTSPIIELRVKEILPHGAGELVLVEAHNRGGKVASELRVRGSISNETATEAREVTIDYLPDGSRKVIGLYFSQPTAGRNLQLHPVGFVEP